MNTVVAGAHNNANGVQSYAFVLPAHSDTLWYFTMAFVIWTYDQLLHNDI